MEELNIEKSLANDAIKIKFTVTNNVGDLFISDEELLHIQADYLKAIEAIYEFAKKIEPKLR